MQWIGDLFPTAGQAVFVALVTTATLGALRLLSPLSRWQRSYKRDSEVLASLPPGQEHDYWQEGVIAQAERIRLYRENIALRDRFWAWAWLGYLFLFIPVLFIEADAGWPSIAEAGLPFILLTALGLGGIVVITVRLVLGHSPYGSGASQYPMYAAHRRAARARGERANFIYGRADRVRRLRRADRRRSARMNRRPIAK